MKRCPRRWLIALLFVTAFACSGEVHTGPADDGDSGLIQAACPPVGPYGVKSGNVAPNVTLYDCDGVAVHLHDLCSDSAAYVVTHAGWCGTCSQFVQSGDANALYDKYEDDGLAMWLVITSTESGQRPTTETCKAYRDQYGLQMTVLIDPDGVTESGLSMLPNSDDMVLRQGNYIELNGSYAIETVESALDGIFAR
jgi:hypothetical protein